MGKRRMLCTDITRSDAFLELGQSSRLLYYDLVQEGDDEGFVDNPKSIMRMTGASEDDLKLLILKKFVIVPDQSKGVVVIKHWYIHNYIRKDRFIETNYKELRDKLGFDENGCYQMTTKCLPNDNQMPTQDKLSKDKLSKDNKRFTPPTLEEVKEYVKEKGLSVDPNKFFNYFNEGNWVDSKGNKVKSWKQKLLTWDNHTTNNHVDTLPTYDCAKNKSISSEEEQELLKLMGKD